MKYKLDPAFKDLSNEYLEKELKRIENLRIEAQNNEWRLRKELRARGVTC